VIITTGRIRRTLVNKINLLVDSPRSIEASRLAPVKVESILLHRASGCFGTSCGSSSTTAPTLRVQVPQHVARLITRLVAPLVGYYFAYVARPGASACRAARHPARRRLLHLRRASGCFGTSRGLSRGSSSTISHRAGSLSTTSPTPRVRVPRHVARLVAPLVVDYSASHRLVVDYSASHRLVVDYSASHRLVVDYFAYAVRPGASARRAACHAARHRQLRLRSASRCLGSSRRSSPTTSPPPCVRVPRHDARLITRLVVDSFNYAARPGASACRAARRVACRRLLRLRRASGCLGTSRGSSHSSSSTPSTTLRVHVSRHVARLVARLVVDYFDYAARPVASARRAVRLAARRRLLCLAQARRRLCRLVQACRRLLRLRRASGCLGTSRGSLWTTSPTPRVQVPRLIARLVAALVADYFASAVRQGASAHRASHHAARR
jgi:hypothetical protein